MEVHARSWVRPESTSRRAVLALDTSSDRASLVLAPEGRDGPILVAPISEGKRHGRGLVPAIRELLTSGSIAPRSLGSIVVGLGPGSFTGLRIGLTAAKTLAYVADCPLAGLDSLALVARNAAPKATRIFSIGDAQRGDLVVADFERSVGGGPVYLTKSARLERADTWPSTLAPGCHVLGPPLGRSEPGWPEGVLRMTGEGGWPDPHVLMTMAFEAVERGDWLDAWMIEPAYARRGAAEEKADRDAGADHARS